MKKRSSTCSKIFELEAVVVGRVTDDGQYLLKHHGQVVCDIPVKTLTDDVLEEPSQEKVPKRLLKAKEMPQWVPTITEPKQTFTRVVATANDRFKRNVYTDL